jgi:hypothetical protein
VWGKAEYSNGEISNGDAYPNAHNHNDQVVSATVHARGWKSFVAAHATVLGGHIIKAIRLVVTGR